MLKPGMVVVSAGGRSDFVSRLVRFATRSNWTHVFIVASETEGIEAWFPTGVRTFDLQARLAQLEQAGREYRVLDLPEISDEDRARVVQAARSFVGRAYDVLEAIVYFLLGVFIKDGTKRLICSRLVTAAYALALCPLFLPKTVQRCPGEGYHRLDQLIDGYVTPAELLWYSELREVDLTGAVIARITGEFAILRQSVEDRLVLRRTGTTG